MYGFVNSPCPCAAPWTSFPQHCVITIILIFNAACDNETLLTANSDLLDPSSSITASSATSGDPVQDLVNRGSQAWCSTEDFALEPYVELNFTSVVSLSYMIARGGVLRLSYVTEFRLEVLDEDSGVFAMYGVTDEPTVS